MKVLWYNYQRCRRKGDSFIYGEVLKWSKRRDSKSRRALTRRVGSNPTFSANKKRTFVYRRRCVFWMMFAFGKWCWLRLMIFASRMMCAWRHIGANIASLRNEVEQHHICEANASYRRRRCLIDDIQGCALIYLWKCDIITAERR